ncbi:transmembrane protease serine 5 [Elysia marginata]|uniref:Transmembrane protease serine 5 n=1 Tax=Elysia marginata TaxID=1093978 RepID=A0AAV4GFL9_9GAST|nr:transmembrane protease serine 5 [Elysia marginata]
MGTFPRPRPLSTLHPAVRFLHTSDACQTNEVIQLSCKQLTCGERQVQIMDSLIASGGLVAPGKWPWVASLSYMDRPICGAVVVGQRWVMTAAHCIMQALNGRSGVDFTKVPFYFSVKAGVNNIFTSDADTAKEPGTLAGPQVFRVANISLHPDNWDLALLELNATGKAEGFEFTELVQPICLPSQGEEFPASSRCYIAGWGSLNWFHDTTSHVLRDARMSVWSELRCKNAGLYRGIVLDTKSTLCGGFLYSGAPRPCKGDSGGPLMCLDLRSRRYKLAGIISQGDGDCSIARPNKVSFAQVAMATGWIKHIMGD